MYDIDHENAEIEILTSATCPNSPESWNRLRPDQNSDWWNVGREALKQEMEIGQGLGLVVEGFGLAAFCLFRLYETHREVTVLATHPDRQRKGDMRFLLSYMLERKSPSERIWLRFMRLIIQQFHFILSWIRGGGASRQVLPGRRGCGFIHDGLKTCPYYKDLPR